MKTCPTCQASYPNTYTVCPADGNPLQEIGTWTEGSVLRGKYRLLAKVGQGGMGSVYKALHLAFDEMRAIKVIAPELLTDELFVKRFKHEAVITRRLQHPNAVRVDDIDEAEDGRPFIVMEFIEGKSLKKLIREEGPLPFLRVCSIIKQSASALEAAHKLGMVHRDIKPDNIALVDTPEGEMVKVLDFGIAKVKEARMGEGAGLTLTGAGVVIGTPQYMSPEQAMGKRGDDLDGRADLYSLGIVMYQMLSADLPFRADTTMEMLLAHMQKAPSPIREAHPELQVPESVASLTMRLLEKDRDKRPASARVLIQEIEKIEQEMSSPAKTRILTKDEMMRAAEAGGPSGSNRGSAAAAPARPPAPPAPPPQAVRPVEPPKPAPPPVVRPQPQVIAAPLRAKRPESRWGLWVALIVLLVGIGGGGLYIATRPSASSPESAPSSSQPANPNPPAPNSTTTPSPAVPQAPQPESVANPPTPTPQAQNPAPTPQPAPPTRKPKPTRVTEAPQNVVTPPTPTPAATVDPKAIKQKLAWGKYHRDRGEYDEAITSYQEGLQLDPSNAQLRQELEKTIKACKSERAALGENFKCGGQ
jgi:serine/threonine-protein kinase